MVLRREFLATGLAGASFLAYQSLPFGKMNAEKSGSKLDQFVYDFENGVITPTEDFSFKAMDDLDTGWIPDYWQSADQTFERGTGDCEDYAILHAAALDRQGYKARLVTGLLELSDENSVLDNLTGINHSITEVENEGEKYVIDVITPDRILKQENYIEELESLDLFSDVSWKPRFSYGPRDGFDMYEENW